MRGGGGESNESKHLFKCRQGGLWTHLPMGFTVLILPAWLVGAWGLYDREGVTSYPWLKPWTDSFAVFPFPSSAPPPPTPTLSLAVLWAASYLFLPTKFSEFDYAQPKSDLSRRSRFLSSERPLCFLCLTGTEALTHRLLAKGSCCQRLHCCSGRFYVHICPIGSVLTSGALLTRTSSFVRMV